MLQAMEQLTVTTLRNVVGSMTLEETLTSRDQINSQLRIVLDEATEKWGVRVTRVELKSIDPPRTIQEAMEQQMRADRAKRATILMAEGEKQAAILRAEGLRAGGDPERRGRPAGERPAGRGREAGAGAAGRGRGRGARQDLRRSSVGRDRPGRHARLQVPRGAARGRRRRREQAAAAARPAPPTRWAPWPAWARRSARARRRPREARPAPRRDAPPAAAGRAPKTMTVVRPGRPGSLVECAASREGAHAPTAPARPGRVHGGHVAGVLGGARRWPTRPRSSTRRGRRRARWTTSTGPCSG